MNFITIVQVFFATSILSKHIKEPNDIMNNIDVSKKGYFDLNPTFYNGKNITFSRKGVFRKLSRTSSEINKNCIWISGEHLKEVACFNPIHTKIYMEESTVVSHPKGCPGKEDCYISPDWSITRRWSADGHSNSFNEWLNLAFPDGKLPRALSCPKAPSSKKTKLKIKGLGKKVIKFNTWFWDQYGNYTNMRGYNRLQSTNKLLHLRIPMATREGYLNGAFSIADA